MVNGRKKIINWVLFFLCMLVIISILWNKFDKLYSINPSLRYRRNCPQSTEHFGRANTPV